ncbi:MAG: hypothetical protein JXB14_03615 [Candidatus Altiarchaeota archaeon]|nr:hypothetical protein [Candidatus Altiarchaeota archaeon]
MKLWIMSLFAGILKATIASAQEAPVNTTVRVIPEEPLFGVITREQLILVVVLIVIVYIIVRIALKLRERNMKKAQAITSEKDRVMELRAEKKRLQEMMDMAKRSFYKRELTEEETNKLMFEYKEKMIAVDAELKRLSEAP